MGIESLVQLYRESINKKVALARNGRIVPMDERILYETETKKSGLFSVGDIQKARQKLLLGELYDKLKKLDKEVLEKVSSMVDNPLLNGTFIWLGEHGGIEQITREEFAEKFEPRDIENETMRIPTYLRPIVLLELIAQFPDKVYNLEESSAFFPHRLFMDRRPTIKQIDLEIAEILPTLISKELINRLEPINKFIKPRQVTGSTYKENWFGKYALPRTASFIWTDTHETSEELDKLYLDIKKEVYQTLAQCFHLIGRHSHERGKSPMKSRAFRISPSDFTIAMIAVQKYARNQLLYTWKNSEGKDVQKSTLSKMVGIKTRIEDGRLVISLRGVDEYHQLDNSYYNTTIRLPFCVYLLKRFYDSATKLNAEKYANIKV